ncbi:conserved hypothetical protein [Ricinus communis]|uniref:Uncharacterized protein n=1 Tax=Ricinus communis TaxID=3988 RepID=B9SXW4_RICCO|nr:conserved hypothetical protein [Ricinus communis]
MANLGLHVLIATADTLIRDAITLSKVCCFQAISKKCNMMEHALAEEPELVPRSGRPITWLGQQDKAPKPRKVIIVASSENTRKRQLCKPQQAKESILT